MENTSFRGTPSGRLWLGLVLVITGVGSSRDVRAAPPNTANASREPSPTGPDAALTIQIEDADLVDPEILPIVKQIVVLRDRGLVEEALAVAKQAYERNPNPQLLIRLAFAEAASKQHARAYVHLREALRDANDRWIQRHKVELERELRERWFAKISLLNLDVRPIDAEVYVNGEPTQVVPKGDPIVVEPGRVQVRVTAAGYTSQERALEVEGGSESKCTFVLDSLPIAPPRSGRPDVALRDTTVADRNPIWLAVAGAGVAVAASALVPWKMGDSQTASLRSHCSGTPVCSDLADRRSTIERLDLVTNVLLITGALTTLASIGAYVLDVEEARESDTTLQVGAKRFEITQRFAF